MALNRIDKPEPLAKAALRIIRHSILTNELTTGVVYNEKSLAKDLGISRTPVREALLELSSKRLVKFLPQKGVIINTFSNKEIDDIFEIRMELEVFTIKKICSNSRNLDLSILNKYFDEQKKAAKLQNVEQFMEAGRKFHIGFTKFADNNYLIDMMFNIRDIMHLMGFKALKIKGRMEEIIHEHDKIFNAILKGDIKKAEEHIKHHIKVSKEAVKRVYQNGDVLS